MTRKQKHEWRETIKKAAKQQGKTAYAIAAETGLRPETVKRYLDGKSDMKTKQCEKVCNVLGIKLQ